MKKKYRSKIIIFVLLLILLWLFVIVFVLHGNIGVVFVRKVAEYKTANPHPNAYDVFYQDTKNNFVRRGVKESWLNAGAVIKENKNYNKFWESDKYTQVITSYDPIIVLTFNPLEDPKYRSYGVVKGRREDENETLYVYLTNYKYTIQYIP